MIKWLILIILILAVSFAGYGLIINDGKIIIKWLDYQVESSFIFFILSLFIIIFIGSWLLKLIKMVFYAPKNILNKWQDFRRKTNIENLVESYQALEIGNLKQVSKNLNFDDPELKPLYPLKLILDAHIAQDDGNEEKLASIAEKLKIDHKTSLVALKLQTELLVKKGNYDEALQLLLESYKNNNKSTWFNITLLEIYQLTENWEQAYLLIKNISPKEVGRINYKKKFFKISFNYGKFLINSNRFDEAIFVLEQAYNIQPTNSDLLEILINLYINQNKAKKAAKLIESCYGESMEKYISLVYGPNDNKIFDKFEQFIKITPSNYLLMLFAAEYALKNSYIEIAKKYLDILTSHDFEHPKLYQLLALFEAKINYNNHKILSYLEKM